MGRVLGMFLIVAIGTVLGVCAVTLGVTWSYPNYYRDSGGPPLVPGIFLGGPIGFVAGLVAAGVWGAWRGRR